MNTPLIGYITSPTCWLVLLGSFLCALTITPVVIYVAHKMQIVRGAGYRRIHKSQTPLMGGLGIAIPFIIVTLFVTTGITGVFRAVGGELHLFYLLAGGATAMALIGLLDDTIKLRARYKFSAQLIVAFIVALHGAVISTIELPFIGVLSLQNWYWLGVFLTVLWIVGITNAVNLIDGMDGLAPGVSLIMAVALAIIAGLKGNSAVVIPCLALAGGLAGFLLFNWHPAKIFLGDTGSLFLGFSLATIALFGAQKSSGSAMIMAAVLAMGVPIFETFISMLRRYAAGFSMFMADDRHTHHRLLRMGFTQHQVALFMYSVTVICMIAAILNSLPGKNALLSTSSLLLAATPFIAIMITTGYVRSIISKVHLRRHTKRKIVLSKYLTLRMAHGPLNGRTQEMLAMVCDEFDLASLSICFCNDTPSGVLFQEPSMQTGDIQQRVGHITLNGGNSQPVQVRYVHKKTPNEEEQHIIEVCLGNIFKNAVKKHLIVPAKNGVPPCQIPGTFVICDNKNPELAKPGVMVMH